MASIGIKKSYHHLHQTLHGNPSKIMLPCQDWELHMFLFFLLISTTTIPGKIIQIYQLFFFFLLERSDLPTIEWLYFWFHASGGILTREHFLHTFRTSFASGPWMIDSMATDNISGILNYFYLVYWIIFHLMLSGYKTQTCNGLSTNNISNGAV